MCILDDVKLQKIESKLTVESEGFVNFYEFTKKKLIWARKSGTILLSTNLGEEMIEKNKPQLPTYNPDLSNVPNPLVYVERKNKLVEVSLYGLTLFILSLQKNFTLFSRSLLAIIWLLVLQVQVILNPYVNAVGIAI